MRSLRARLLAAWVLSLLAAVVVGAMLLGLYRQSSGVQQARAAEAASAACEAIADRFAYFAAGWAGPLPEDGTPDAAALRTDLAAVVAFALGEWPGIAGGLWLGSAPLAASAGLDADLRATLATLAATVAEERGAATSIRGADAVEFVQACAVSGPLPGLTAFAIATVPETPGQQPFLLGVGGLFLLVLAMTLLLGWAAFAWSRRIGGLTAALASIESGGLPLLAPTGEHDLDRIVAALNQAGTRLRAAQEAAAAMAARMAQAERLAALGRVAAGVAHEVRNPVAAMRLRAENGLAGDEARRRAALEAILAQVGRLERLTGELLAMTQTRSPTPAPGDLAAALAACAGDHETPGVAIVVDAPAITVALDWDLLRRALDAVVQNAVQHTPPGGTVRLAARRAEGRLAITVADSGPGVDKALRATLFEPFVSGRPDGTGLGLAIAREMLDAMGGGLALLADGPGATFGIEVPCPMC
jgi:signal transduction histidine kinase